MRVVRVLWYLEFADDDDCGGYGGGVDDRIDVLLYSMLFPYLDFSLSRFRGGGGKEGGRGLKKKSLFPNEILVLFFFFFATTNCLAKNDLNKTRIDYIIININYILHPTSLWLVNTFVVGFKLEKKKQPQNLWDVV